MIGLSLVSMRKSEVFSVLCENVTSEIYYNNAPCNTILKKSWPNRGYLGKKEVCQCNNILYSDTCITNQNKSSPKDGLLVKIPIPNSKLIFITYLGGYYVRVSR